MSFGVAGAVNTFGQGIGNAGNMTGYYIDSSNRPHGFDRRSAGVITTFDDPGVPPCNTSKTTPSAIDAKGIIGGTCGCPALLGFARDVAGTVINFGVGEYSTGAASINAAGATTGFYADFPGAVSQGFVRTSGGAVTKFAAPGTSVTTSPAGINAEGVITGVVYETGGVCHGFLRAPDGTPTLFDDPSAASSANQDTLPGGINSSLAIGGFYYDPAARCADSSALSR